MTQLVFANLVAETATAAGTGAFALQGAVSAQYSSFSTKIQIGKTVVYTARQGALYEVGYGVLTSSTQLTRVGVYDSSSASGYVNSVTPGSPGFVSFDNTQTLTIYNDVPAQLFLAQNPDGSIASPTSIRKSIFVDTNTQMKALGTYADGETVFVTGFGDSSGIQPGLFRFNAGTSTAPDGVDTFRNDNSSTGLYQRQKLVIQGNFQGSATFDATTSGGGFTSKEYANPSSSNANDYFARIVDASASAWRWASRLNQSGVKNFLNLFSPGNAQDRIEAAVPIVQASVADATGLKARTLTWLSGVSRLAFARVDAANATTATDYREIPLTKGGYIVASVKDIYDLKQIDPTSAGSGFADYDMAQTRGLNTASSDSGHSLTGSVAPVFWYWFSTSTLSEDLVNVVRPSVGSAASGNGRWIREVSDITAGGTFTSSVATPSVKNGGYFITAGTTAITNFLNGYEGQRIIVQRGSADIVITHNASYIDLGGTNVTLNATGPRLELIYQSGVWRSLGGGSVNASTNLTGQVPIANGGTGASSASAAITALGVPAVTLSQAASNQFFVQNGAKLNKLNDRVFISGASVNSADLVQYTGAISALTNLSSTSAQATVSSTASMSSGQFLTISGATGANAAQYNGTFAVTVTSSTTFTYVTSGLSGAATGSPIYTFYGPTTKDWLLKYTNSIGGYSNLASSQVAVLTDENLPSGEGGNAFVAAAQSKTFSNAGQSAIGNFGIVVNNNTSYATSGWAFYGEAYKANATVASVYGMELDTWTAVSSIQPTSTQQGDVVGLQLGSGAQVSNGQDASAAIQVVGNPNKFKAGLVFGSTSLTSGGLAIALYAAGSGAHSIKWTNANGSTAGFITSTNTSTTNFASISFEAGGLTFRATDNAVIAQFAPYSGYANFLYFSGGNTGAGPTIQAAGSDTDVNLNLTAKGAGYINPTSPVKLPVYTIATLPNSPVAGMRGHCSNASVTTFLTALGTTTGANFVPIFYNGSAWIVG